MLAAAIFLGCSSSTGSSASSDNTLSNMTVSAGTLTPSFSASVTSYGDAVPNGTTSVTVTPTASSSKATIQVLGVDVTSGSASAAEALTVGPNLIDVAVFAENGDVRIYDVTVTRSAGDVVKPVDHRALTPPLTLVQEQRRRPGAAADRPGTVTVAP